MTIQYNIILLNVYIFTLNGCHAIEPITVGIGITAALSSVGVGVYNFWCDKYECCNENWIKPKIEVSVLKEQMDILYGQHLAKKATIRHLKAQYDDINPPTALAISLHGSSGTGKNYITGIIAKYVYKNGEDSKFYHFFNHGHFPDNNPTPETLNQYKAKLRDMVITSISACGRSMFIFDEVEVFPPGLINVLIPYLEHGNAGTNVNSKRAMFFFLSNVAGKAINNFTLNRYLDGKKREDIPLRDIENVIARHAFNAKYSGFWLSDIISKGIVTAFVPFLPLEKKHVKLCIRDTMKKKNYADEQFKSNYVEIMEQLEFYPDNMKIFSTFGCKRVKDKINFIMTPDL